MEGRLIGFLLTAILFGLLGLSGILVIKFGIANVPPRHILILRNVITGNLIGKKPGLRVFFPGFEEKFRMVDCRKTILDPPNLPVTSRDGQRVEVDYQVTYWADGFDEDGKIKAGQVIKAILRIGEQKTTGVEKIVSPEEFKKDLEVVVLKESNVAIQNTFGNHFMDDLVGKKELLDINCPYCGSLIKGGEIGLATTTCPKTDCKMHEKEGEIPIPPDFYGRLSWAAGIELHNRLKEKFGLACFLSIRNVLYPQEVEAAARAQQVAAMEGEATKTRVAKITGALKTLIEETKTDPNVAFLGESLLGIVPTLVAALKGEKRKESTGRKPKKKTKVIEETEEEEEEE